MFANLKKENEDLTQTLNNEKQNHINYKLNEKVSSDFESTKWTDETDNYKKIGLWNAEIQNKYTFKLEDEFVYDMEGNVVKDEKGTGKLTRRALFDRIAEKAGALKKNGATETATSKSKKPENLLPHEEAHFNMREQLKAKYAPKA
jgi:uncharacterized cupin superfamily protein